MASSAEMPTALATSVESTLQHIRLIQRREARLAQARTDALVQLLHSIGTEFRAGRLTQVQLISLQASVRALGIVGVKTFWNEAVDVEWTSLLTAAKKLPNGPAGTWVGEYPYQQGACVPQSGFSVVYVLFDQANEPCYVGSTKHFSDRLRNHRRDGKQFVRWQAYPCRDREHAYEVEERLLKEHMPYLNRKASR